MQNLLIKIDILIVFCRNIKALSKYLRVFSCQKTKWQPNIKRFAASRNLLNQNLGPGSSILELHVFEYFKEIWQKQNGDKTSVLNSTKFTREVAPR